MKEQEKRSALLVVSARAHTYGEGYYNARRAAFAAVAATLLFLPPPLGGGGAAPAAAAATGPGIANCTRSCGNIDIPYPFGVEAGCYHATGSGSGFNLTCDLSYHPPKLFLGDGTVPVLEISIPNNTVRINSSSVNFTNDGVGGSESSGRTVNKTWGLGGGPNFVLSDWYSMLQAIGCNVQVDLRGGDENKLIASCAAICPNLDPQNGGTLVGDGSCAGIRCCKANINFGYSFYNIQMRNLLDGSPATGGSSAVYIVDRDFSYNQSEGMPPQVPATLSWTIAINSSCPTNNMSAPECRSNHSSCLNTSIFVGSSGYMCRCSDGYQGNPYIDGGCQDLDECSSLKPNVCYGDCKNTQGSFICLCPAGYKGNAYVPNGCKDIDECENPEVHGCYGTCQNLNGTFLCQCPNNATYGNPYIKDGCVTIAKKNSFTGLGIGLGVGGGISLLLALGAPFMIRGIKLQKEKKMREKFFDQNHGLLLQQLVSHNADIGERMIITLREIEKATNNFDRSRVIGGGGHGVVFKGMVDLKVVAIKKSKILVQREIDEFINEVAVLSQVNHRNVVKLLGCCLETEVPLLVYEFISNGTLYQHLHVEGPSLPWVDRIRIALEVARALSYLHSAASMPIFHRDIKSTNILLDDSLTAKVSDFGTSRYIQIDQTEVTTEVQGTQGYLDPMYYYTGRLTDKSDVFSFGVLLIELLTRKKPFVYRSEHGDILVSHFRKLLAIGNLVGIVDCQVMEEEDGEVREVAAVAAMCTKLRGEDRPTMREVEIALESILVKKKQIPCTTTTRRPDEDETPVHYTSVELVSIEEGREYIMEEVNGSEESRQYTMEEEVLLSASYPR